MSFIQMVVFVQQYNVNLLLELVIRIYPLGTLNVTNIKQEDYFKLWN